MSRELLDPKARTMLEEMEAANRPNADELPIEQARENLENLFARLGAGPDVAEVVDRAIPGPGGEIPVRVLRGHGAGPDRPLIVYFHGGGHSQGSIETHDSLCRGLANACRATVVNVEYRRAPENPFPAPYEDAVAATEWALEAAGELGADPEAVIVAGDSAGGNLAAAVCATTNLRRRLAAQLLIYPLASFARQRELYDPAFEGFFLAYSELAYFQGLYVPEGADLADPRLSPLGSETLAEVPPAVIVAAQCDPIHPQSAALHERLTEAGVPSKRFVVEGMIHGFYGMTTLFEQAQQAFDTTATELDSTLNARARS